MKTSLCQFKAFTAAGLGAACIGLLASAPAWAGPGAAGHDHGPQHGGVVREVKNLNYELVAQPKRLTLHVSSHGKPVSTAGASAQATLFAGNERVTVKLAPAGENRLEAEGNFRTGVGVRVAVDLTLAGQQPTRVNFNLR